MKFLCDNCKAKYQIADEKVAGKTVRMKCRKCGHQIEVRAAVTETSVSTSPPTASGERGSEAPRPLARTSLATSLSAAKPRAPMSPHGAGAGAGGGTGAGGALAGAFQRNVQEAPQTAPFPGAQHNNPVELSVTDEWYVAINGVPVGPVRISELRRKAGSGAVTEESLCWQEGLEEWRPVRSIPELAAIVREAAQGNRPSLVAPPPSNEGRTSSPPRAPQRPAPPAPARPSTPEPPFAGGGGGAAPAPPRPMAPSRSNVVPLRVAASSNLEQNDLPPVTAPLGGGNAGAAALAAFSPQPSFSPQMQPQPLMQPLMQHTPAPLAISDPFALPPQAPPPAMAAIADNRGPATSSVFPPAPYGAGATPSMAPIERRRGVPLWFWPILLFTGVFGVSAAVFVFRQQQPQPPVVIQVQPTAAPTAADPKTTPDVPPVASNEPAPPTTATGTGAKVAGGTAAKGTGTGATPTPKGGGIDLGGLVGGGAGGPAVGGGGGATGPGPGGAGLDGASVERTVAQHRNGVKRTCWERGGPDQKSSVNVTITATVASDGSVASTSSSGDDPVVAKCIESQVRSWRFSAPGSTTTVNIPFKFVRQ